jgi:hypothetical protein
MSGHSKIKINGPFYCTALKGPSPNYLTCISPSQYSAWASKGYSRSTSLHAAFESSGVRLAERLDALTGFGVNGNSHQNIAGSLPNTGMMRIEGVIWNQLSLLLKELEWCVCGGRGKVGEEQFNATSKKLVDLFLRILFVIDSSTWVHTHLESTRIRVSRLGLTLDHSPLYHSQRTMQWGQLSTRNRTVGKWSDVQTLNISSNNKILCRVELSNEWTRLSAVVTCRFRHWSKGRDTEIAQTNLNRRFSKPILTLEEHFRIVLLVFRFNHFRWINEYSDFSQNNLSPSRGTWKIALSIFFSFVFLFANKVSSTVCNVYNFVCTP